MADSIARSLRREGMAVDVAYDGITALRLAGENDYDVVLLDRDVPGVHGDDVCRQLAGGASRILMLTASGTVDDRVEGLTLGADDYLPKPFVLAELCPHPSPGPPDRSGTATVLMFGDIRLDPHKREMTRAGRRLALTNKELGVLEVLMAANGGVVSVEDLLTRVWDAHADPFTNTVRVTLTNLRRKLGDPPVIETVIGSGYRMMT